MEYMIENQEMKNIEKDCDKIFIPVRSDQEYCSKRCAKEGLGPEAGPFRTVTT